MTDDIVEVTQADREAAKALLDTQAIRYHRDGTFRDWDNTVQAFARHRLASEARSSCSGEVERLRSALREIDRDADTSIYEAAQKTIGKNRAPKAAIYILQDGLFGVRCKARAALEAKDHSNAG